MSKAEQTRQFIIEKTAPIFNAKGYAGTSLNDITDATGLTKGSIYGNFENKDEVALAAFDYNFQRVVSHIRNEMEKRDTSIGKLMVYPETYRNYFKLPFLGAGCPLLNTATEADDTHPALRKKAADAIAFWKKAVMQHLKTGIKEKEIKAGTDIEGFASVLISLVEGGMLQAKLTGKMDGMNSSMKHLEKLIRKLKA